MGTPSIGLVLSGGGARGLAHLGLLKGLEELGMRPSMISGVSAGALIAALYAAGLTPQEILQLAKDETSFNLTTLVLSPLSLFSSSGLKRVLKAHIPKDSFSELKIPIFVTVTDVANGSSLTYSSGPLLDVLVGSSSIPALFEPVEYEGHYMVDGGVLNNFPVECIIAKCGKVIGSHVNKLYDGQERQMNKLHVLEKCFHLAIANTVASKSMLCDLFVEPPLAGYTMFDMKHADAIFEAGYNALMEHKEVLQGWMQ